MKRRAGLLVILCCLFGTGLACSGKDEAAGNDGDGNGDDVSPTAGQTSTAGQSASGGSNSAGSSSGPSGGSPAAGGSPNSGGSPATTGGTNSGGNLNTGGSVIGAECLPSDPLVCLDESEIQLCVDGIPQSIACETLCEEADFEPGGCVNDGEREACDCGPPVDPECLDGAIALCFCYQELTGEICDELTALSIYWACNDKYEMADQYAACYRGHVMENEMGELVLDCDAAYAACGGF